MTKTRMGGEGPSCPLCRTASSLLEAAVEDFYFGSPGQWDYFRCQNAACAVAFPSPSISDDVLTQSYSKYYTHSLESSGRIGQYIDNISRFVLPPKEAYKRSYILNIPLIDFLFEQQTWSLGGMRGAKSGTALDIGCGSGDRLPRLRAVGWGTVIGVEPDPHAVEVARDQARDVREGTAESLPLAEATVEGAIMHHVVEHIRDPLKALQEVTRVLRPGGTLFAVTPNIDSALRQEVGGRWRGFEAPRHLTIFTVQALAGLARDAGLEPILVTTSSRSAAWMRAISTGQDQPRSRIHRLLDAHRHYRAQKRDIASGRQVGDEIVMIARKPMQQDAR